MPVELRPQVSAAAGEERRRGVLVSGQEDNFIHRQEEERMVRGGTEDGHVLELLGSQLEREAFSRLFHRFS